MKDFGKSNIFIKYFLIISVFIVSFFSIYAFMSNIQATIKEQTNSILRNTTRQVSDLFRIEMESKWEALAPIARFAANQEDMLHSEELRKLMRDLQQEAGYFLVYAADRSGSTLTTDDTPLFVADSNYFLQAMQGKKSISDIIFLRTLNRQAVVIEVPITYSNKIKGAFCAAMSPEKFEQIVGTTIFIGGYGNSYIVAGDGDIIVKSYDKDLFDIAGIDNIIDYFSKNKIKGASGEDLLERIQNGEEGTFTFYHGGHTDYAYFAPLGINGWYTICMVPDDIIKDQTRDLYTLAVILIIGLAVTFLLVIVYIVNNHRIQKRKLEEKNHELLMNEKRFRIISSLTNNIIFEWNILSGDIVFPNGFEEIMGYMPVSANFPESIANSGHIHPEDAKAFIELHKNLPKDKMKISGDFRMKYQGDKYIWCRFDEFLLRDESGTAIKTIGRVLDIDKEKIAMEILKTRTQIDGGSGLYNKKTTELLIKKCLEKESSVNHALLIVDIDDFKKINDNNGHLFGDQVVSDVSSVMKDLFRASDIVGRIGGDEFMVLVRDIPNDFFVATKISRMIKNIRNLHDVTVSVGIAIYPTNGTSYVQLYKNADSAMYEAKAKGKKCFVFYSDKENESR